MSTLERYRDPTEGAVRFVREQVVLADGRRVGLAMRDDPWVEHDLLRPVFARDDDGLPRHRLVYLELPRGHWKSGGAAAVAIAEAVLFAGTDIVVAAADKDQAAIVTENIAGYLARNAGLRASFRVRGGEYAVPVRGSRIRVIGSDVPSSWGLGGTHRRFRVIADELTAWPGERGEAFWTSLISATGKTPDAQTIVLSNAGYGAGHSWQWRVREAAERESWGYLFSANGVVASWITAEWIERMRTLLPPAAFDRLILNRWSSEAGDFVTRDQWRRCVDPGLIPQTVAAAGVPYYAGLDLGLVKDRTALAIVHLDPEENVVLDDLMVWQGTRADPVDIAAVERAASDAARRFPGLRIAADPWQLQASIQRLRSERVRIDEFSFSSGSIARLSATLYALISEASLRVYEDEELEREVLSLRVVQTTGGWRIDHQAGGYSDRAIALGMAAQIAVGRRARWRAAEATLSGPGYGRYPSLALQQYEAIGTLTYDAMF